MLRLAEWKGKCLLVKTRGSGTWEYWYVLPTLEYSCLNSQSVDYNATNALEHLAQVFGPPDYVRPTIKAC